MDSHPAIQFEHFSCGNGRAVRVVRRSPLFVVTPGRFSFFEGYRVTTDLEPSQLPGKSITNRPTFTLRGYKSFLS